MTRRLVARLGGPVVRVVLVAVALVWMFPVVGLLVASLRPEASNARSGWWTVFTAPAQLTLANYVELMADRAVLGSLWNTVLIAVPSTVLVVVIGAFAAYALAWIEFPGRDVVMIGVVALLVVPVQVALVPVAELLGGIGLYGSIPGVIAFHVAFGMPFAVFLLRNYIGSLPSSIIESAKIDGADHFTIFWRLIVPLSVPALAAFGIFQFLWVWNDLLVAYVFLGGTRDTQVVTIALQILSGTRGQEWHLLTAAAFVTMSLPLIVFFSLQRYFVRGLTAGSVKG